MSARPVTPAVRPIDAQVVWRGLEMLSTAVLVVDFDGRLMWANQSAESVFGASRRTLLRHPVKRLFVEEALVGQLVSDARANSYGQRRQMLTVRSSSGHEPVSVHAVATVLTTEDMPLLLELTELEQQLKLERGERANDVTEANRRLLRNLAHEIKNPLGGIRGAAQLLEAELPADEREYTRVIIHEADRLQALVDRVLAPHRSPRVVASVNIHEVCERVRSVVLAEFPRGLTVTRDYDASAPEFAGDREQLIQALLNIIHNAAQALEERIRAGDAEILLRTRVARRVTISRRVCRLALDLRVIDNGPGIPEDIQDRIFLPLVSGREGGSGLGLTLAQAYVLQNDGAVEFDSRPGRTEFRILLPIS